ncbi:MAG: RHS repeat-associated core domain-containing protein [Anaerolineales bacterium]
MDTNGSTTTKVYYAFAGQTIAMRNGPPGTPMEYFLTDQLGSVILALDASGNPIAGTQQRYMPFGQPRFNNTPVTDFAYTGQRDLDLQGNSFSLGLMDYNARFYDDYITHFSQPDTMTQGGPQGLNLYSYTLNNPINFNDPSGHCIGEDGTHLSDANPECQVPPAAVQCVIAPGQPDCSTKNNGEETSGGGDTSIKRILIGSFSGLQPYLMDSPEEPEPEEDDPSISGLFDLINELLGAGQNIDAMVQKPDISVYLNYTRDSQGNVTIPSLTINNQSGSDLSVMYVGFYVTNRNFSYGYDVQSEDMLINAGDSYPGIRAGGGRLSVSTVDLEPINLPAPTNTFNLWDYVTISVSIANRNSGQFYPMQPFSSYVWQIGR